MYHLVSPPTRCQWRQSASRSLPVTSFRVVLTDFTDPHQQIETDVFNASGLDISLVRADPGTDRDLAILAPTADALLVQFAQVRKDVIDSLHNCKVISRYGIGVDMIDLEAAAARGIPVANVPDFCIDEVSTQTIGFLIDLNRHTHDLDELRSYRRLGASPGFRDSTATARRSGARRRWPWRNRSRGGSQGDRTGSRRARA